MHTSAKQCKARTKNGTRCSGYAVAGSDFCFTHDPASGRARAQARRHGGQARRIPKVAGDWQKKLESIADVIELINLTILDTWQLENSAPRSRVLLSAAEVAIKALSVGELEDRVKALENALKVRDTQ